MGAGWGDERPLDAFRFSYTGCCTIDIYTGDLAGALKPRLIFPADRCGNLLRDRSPFRYFRVHSNAASTLLSPGKVI